MNTAYPGFTKRLDPADGNSNRLTSEELADLILDALIVGGVLRKVDFKRARLITCEEIDARKAVGDY